MLHQLPIETIKIDRSFVARLQASGESAEFVKTIVTLARSLELEVIAEGVERPEQVWLLGQLGCRFGQGFNYSRAVAADAVEALFSEPWRGQHQSPKATARYRKLAVERIKSPPDLLGTKEGEVLRGSR
jgi:EAL domain-containing protein (putative c-di-GMP-specific phosphodiesterase class I)